MRMMRRFGRDRRAVSAPVARPAPLPPGGGAEIDRGNLLDLRKLLAEDMARLQWDLGGLAYEMAIRDHFRLDVLIAQAAKLQDVDAELGVVERLLRMEQGGAAGTCPSCGALHSRGAQFCEQCGTRLLNGSGRAPERLGESVREAPTTLMDADVVDEDAGPPPPPPPPPPPSRFADFRGRSR